ncbi:PQQ-binding-like beta-propeller repeat protein [Halomonas huangheensis]|uniref:Glutamine cyclotransferase n=1 Tax=Halomonas huangheensis TaxID=1178482 RepID=W1N6V2_9GAMM|nr:PQQ-binding-like beta-propeller repeat protein [Halomonas huangheensis]ALM54322.1 glutamine cyclotransferase [Halomonas huangheensis]ERL50881.1 hypothetical protein BJB45_19990 [Halomonas huangheensis]
MTPSTANVIHEYSLADVDSVNGVTHDGQCVWVATGERLIAIDPNTGKPLRSLDVTCDAGTAFDGHHLFQLSGDKIHKVDPQNARIIATIPAPNDGLNSGMAWGEGSLWVGQYKERRIHQLDPETGEILRTIRSDRFVTGVTWCNGELWHGTWENDQSDIRRIDPQTGQVLECLEMPTGKEVSGLESDGNGQFFCGGGDVGMLRVVRRPQ